LTVVPGVIRAADGPFAVTISVDASKPAGEMRPVWRYFGADERLHEGRQQADRRTGRSSPHVEYFRTHNLLTTGDGTPALEWGSTNAYTEDAVGKPIYDWTIVDRIFDAYLQRGVTPDVQIGFMPKAMSTKPERTMTSGRRRPSTTRSIRAGPTRRRITGSGANSCSSGRSTASSRSD
jgi:xylan 1,4-beta-xylosidase